jgi:hypothetical protein
MLCSCSLLNIEFVARYTPGALFQSIFRTETQSD